MSEIHYGDIIDSESAPLQFKLPQGVVVIWRDVTPGEAVICESRDDVPAKWRLDQLHSWKVFGEFSFIKTLFPDLNFPPGSKVVDLAPGAVIQINPAESSIRYLGKRKKRVVIVDDSPTIRKLLKHIMAGYEDWNVVAEVERGEDIPAAIKAHHPDLLTLDLHLGEMNGVEAMKKFLAPKKVPTVLITSQPMKDGGLVMDALSAGALDYLQKPESGQWDSMKEEMYLKMEAALKSKWQVQTPAATKKATGVYDFNPEEYIVAIGSSTGGTQALQQIFTNLPEVIPPIIVTQHIPAGFSKALAVRLNGLCPFEIKEAEHGDEVRAGRVLIAPGDHHMRLAKGGKTVEVFAGEPVNRFRPSVEVMFDSVRAHAHAKTKVVAIMLTGMGKDGAEAMLGLRKNGAFTIAQDEASCVVFGMPKEAIRIGAAEVIKPLSDIPQFLMSYVSQKIKMKKGS